MSNQMKLQRALVERLEATVHCPACGAFGGQIETFDGDVCGFVAERLYGCGARVQVSAKDTLDVSDGCPETLRQAFGEIEDDVRDAEDAA